MQSCDNDNVLAAAQTFCEMLLNISDQHEPLKTKYTHQKVLLIWIVSGASYVTNEICCKIQELIYHSLKPISHIEK